MALPMAASGFRSSWASMARNSSFRLSFSLQLLIEPLPLSLSRPGSGSRRGRQGPRPRIVPVSSSLMGAALSSMGRIVPSFAVSTVWFARPTTLPFAEDLLDRALDRLSRLFVA